MTSGTSRGEELFTPRRVASATADDLGHRRNPFLQLRRGLTSAAPKFCRPSVQFFIVSPHPLDDIKRHVGAGNRPSLDCFHEIAAPRLPSGKKLQRGCAKAWVSLDLRP